MFIPLTLIAQIPTITYTQGKYQAQAPDWSKITWDALPPVQQMGYLAIPQKYISIFGYDPSRSWSAGQKVDSVVMLGDADDAFKMSNFSLKSIGAMLAATPKENAPQTKELTLKDFGLMQWQTPESLVKAIPGLGNLYVNQVPPLEDLLSQAGIYNYGTISEIVEYNPQLYLPLVLLVKNAHIWKWAILPVKREHYMVNAGHLVHHSMFIAKYIDAIRGKAKLATARWGGSGEKTAARQLGCKQINKRQHNRVCLFVGTPQNTKSEIVNGIRKTQIPTDAKTLYFPEAQRGILVCGGPGSGKSFSMINPLIRSAVDQGFPLILYDFKYAHQESATASSKGQAPILAGYAALRGYQVTVLAPGFAESAVANPIDFLRNNEDSEMARQLAITLNRNFQLGEKDSGNSFFTNAGDQLVQAVFMLAKGTLYPDIMMCQAILGLPKLVKRVELAENLNFMVREAFAQFVSVAGSPETAASIVGTASGLFSRFMVPAALAAFCGKTNIPLDLKGRQMVIFGMNKEKRDVIAPLLVSILHLIISRNVAYKRTCPLVLGIDELPTLYLPALVDWLNQNREDGLISILGLQNLSMLIEAYGENTTNAIFGGCATKAFFNPQDDVAAERFSKFLGEEEIKYKQRSRSLGGKGGASISNSDQNSTRKLFDINQFNTLPEGKAVIISPGFRSRGQISIPILQNIHIPQHESDSEAASVKAWYKFQKSLAMKSILKPPADEEMRIRRAEALKLLPLIENQEQLSEYASLI